MPGILNFPAALLKNFMFTVYIGQKVKDPVLTEEILKAPGLWFCCSLCIGVNIFEFTS